MNRRQNRNRLQEASSLEALPVESWQVVSVERLPGDRECDSWGHDGRRVLAWFDLGDLQTALAEEAWTHSAWSVRLGLWARLRAWLRSILFPADVAWNV